MSKIETDLHAEINEDHIEKIEIELLLEGIFRHYGFDFRDYSFSSIKRRIWHRARIENAETISDLQAKVLHQPAIMDRLLNDFSINVTEMFRDPPFFKLFREEVIPILRTLPAIRIWHAGCSSGEEVYSMAILLHEEGLYEKTRIYATDMNELILDKASMGILPLYLMKQYTKNYLLAGGVTEFSEYYQVNRDQVLLSDFIKKNITFAHHNLVTDHSFNEFHVIICRNVLIYFNNQLKNRVHTLFYQSLSPQGFLGLGSKESISGSVTAKCYEEISGGENIYRKVH